MTGTTKTTPVQAFAGDEYDAVREARAARRFEDEQEATFLAEHPEISEAVPSWADDVMLDFDAVDNSNTITFTAEKAVGEIEVVELGRWCGGEVTVGIEHTLFFPSSSSPAMRSRRELASYARARAIELLTIAAMLEAEDAS